jgi:23S rRNA (pseudouridine1915-N3)-methyltransferase
VTKFTIIAIGRCKDKAVLDLVERYSARMNSDVTIRELAASSKPSGRHAMDDEAGRMLEAARGHPSIVALDERGKDLGSEQFADQLRQRIETGRTPIAILIGGADGLGDAARACADLTLRFGRMTWPHMLVRAMLLEQLYRAETIQRGHPYHRS